MPESRVDPPLADSPDGRTEPPELDAVVARATILEGQLAAGAALMPFLAARDDAARAREAVSAAARRSELAKWLVAKGLWSRMTDTERRFVEAAPHRVPPQDLIDVSWSAESLRVLLWALGHVEALAPYDVQSEPPREGRSFFSTGDGPPAASKLRDRREIERARDVAELWHWRSRTRELQEDRTEVQLPEGETLDDVVRVVAMRAAQDGVFPFALADDFPVFGRPYREASPDEWASLGSIALERHKALNWLCGYAPGNRWDETPTDT
jgi:hypothetical protein